jgi:hypothetical protein
MRSELAGVHWLRSSKIVSNQYCLSSLSEQRTLRPSTANTVISDPPGNLLKTSSPRLNISMIAIVVSPTDPSRSNTA